MKKIPLLTLIILIFSLPGFGQVMEVNEHVHSVTCDHAEPCLILGPIDQVAVDATRVKIIRIRNTSSMRSMYEFDREQMPLYIYFPYDAEILNDYSFDDFRDMVMSNIVDGIIESNQCSGVNFSNYRIVFEPIYDIPEYSSIYDIMNFLSSNGSLNYVRQNKQINDWHYLLFLTKANISGKGIANMATEEFPIVDIAVGVVDFQEVVLGSITGVHEFGHLNGLDHQEGQNGSISLPFSRAMKADAEGYRSPVASSNILLYEVRCWTGPNSYAVNYLGDTVHLYDGVCNNAATMDIGIQLFRDGIDRTMVQLFDHDQNCGIATVTAVTNNADTWEWVALDGANVDIDVSGEGDVADIVAYEAATIMVVGKNSDKIYGDTVYFDMPALTTADDGTLEVCETDGLPILLNGDTAVAGQNTYLMTDGDCFVQHTVYVEVAEVEEVDQGITEICEDDVFPVLDNGETAVEGLNTYYMPNGICDAEYTLEVIVREHTRITADTTLASGEQLFGNDVTDGDVIEIVFPGEGEYCDLIITYTVSITTGVINIDNETDIVLYPNPTQNVFNIKGVEEIQEVHIYDLSGRLVKRIFASQQIDISNLPDNWYSVRVITNDAVYSGKVIKAVPRA